MKILRFFRRHLAVLISIAVAVVVIAGIIVLMNVMTGSNQGATPDEAQPTTVAHTTVQPTTAAPTTAQPTTVAPTTVAPTTVQPTNAAPAAEDADDFVGGVGGYDIGGGTGSHIDSGDKSDMDGSKDSSSKDTDNEGRPIVYGGDEGYGADTSGKHAPVPEEQFEERHPLPDPVNPETDFPDSKTITYEEIQSGVEPEEGDIISLTPAN